jgi:hypothetical protein
MADRVQVQEIDTFRSGRTGGGPLDAVAKPTDAYYRPTARNVAEANTHSELGDLAAALQVAGPKIENDLLSIDKNVSEQQMKEGIRAREKNQKDFRTAVKEGLIPEAANPWFVKGYMQQDGRLSARDLNAARDTAWANSEVKESTNPHDLTTFMNDFSKKYIEDHKLDMNNPDFADSFNKAKDAGEANLQQQHVAHRQAEISRLTRVNTANEIGSLLHDQQKLEEGYSPNDPIVMAGRQAVAKQIEALAAAKVKEGLPGSEANLIAAKTVIAKGIELEDSGYARNILDNIKTPGGQVSRIVEVAGLLNSSETHIRSQLRQEKLNAEHDEDRPFAVASRDFGQKQIEHTKKQWAKEEISYDRAERVRGLTNRLTMQILAEQPVDPRDLQKLANDDASAAAWITNYQHTNRVQKSEIITNQPAFAAMMLKLADNPSAVTARDIFGGVTSGTWDKGTAMTLWNEREQMMGPGHDPANRDPYFTSLNHGLVSSLTADVTNVSGSAQLDASNAAVEFRKFYAELPDNLKPSEKMAALRKKQLEIMEHYNKIGLMKSKAAQDAGIAKPTTIRGENGAPAKPAGPPPTPGVTTVGGNPVSIPPSAIEALMQHPEKAQEFEEKYNLVPGSSKALLRKPK